MNREEIIDHLADAVVFTVQCSKCHEVADTMTCVDTLDYGKVLFEKGWRGNKNGVYCPVCVTTFKLK